MLTYIVRHGRTAYSASYRVNGDRRVPVLLDHEGRAQCWAARGLIPLHRIASATSSAFPRAVQTAGMLAAGAGFDVDIDDGLDEIDYGLFEGGPFAAYADWLKRNGPRARPPGASESQREALRRMLSALYRVLEKPGPRLVVTHGLLVSVLGAGQCASRVFFAEAPYVRPRLYRDDELAHLLDALARELDTDATFAESSLLPVRSPGRLDTFGPTPVHQEEEDTHA